MLVNMYMCSVSTHLGEADKLSIKVNGDHSSHTIYGYGLAEFIRFVRERMNYRRR